MSDAENHSDSPGSKSRQSSVELLPVPEEQPEKDSQFNGQTVFLTGATGFIGGNILRHLIYHGYMVKCLVREKSREKLPPHKQIVPVPGDFTKPESYSAALQDVAAVINLVGAMTEPKGADMEELHHLSIIKLIAEMKSAEVKRLVHISIFGADAKAREKLLYTKWLGEESIRKSGLEYTIFRPCPVHGIESKFIRGLAKKARSRRPITVVGNGNVKSQPVHVGDVADVVVDSISRSKSFKKEYDVGGPEQLTRDRIINIFCEKLVGKCKTKIYFPVNLAVFSAYMLEKSGRRPGQYSELIKIYAQEMTCDTAPLCEDFGIKLRDFASCVEQYKKAGL